MRKLLNFELVVIVYVIACIVSCLLCTIIPLNGLLSFSPLIILLAVIIYILLYFILKNENSFGLVLLVFFLLGIFNYLCHSIQIDSDLELNYFTKSKYYISNLIDNLSFEHSSSRAFIKALVLGDKTELSKDIIISFRKSGTAHILALSGLHLGMIYLIINKLLYVFGNYRYFRLAKSLIIIILCIYFSLMVGASSSIIRACIFIIIHQISILSNRRISLWRTVCLAIFIQLSINPLLIKSLSLQLSYSAILGIVFIFPFLSSFYPKQGSIFLKKLWDLIILSISCQITTSPISYYYFRYFPKYFIISNLIALPLTSIIFLLSILNIFLITINIQIYFLISINDILIQALLYCMAIISSL